MDAKTLARFRSKFIVHPRSRCWVWTGGRIPTGYGAFWTGENNEGAHRLSYELHIGPIADDMFICHTCDVRHCVNPDHLFIGSHADNMRDMREKGRQSCREGEAHHLSKLIDDQVRAIRADERPHRAIAAEYNIGQTAVSKIKARKRWAHI